LHPKISIEEKGGNVYTQLRRDLREINGAFVKVGFPEGGKVGSPNKRKETGLESMLGMSSGGSNDMSEIAKIAAWNEFGVPKKQTETEAMLGIASGGWAIPPRPAIRTAIDTNREELKAFKAKVYEQVLLGKLTPKQGLDMVGLWMQKKMRDSVLRGHWKPNKPSTIKAKGSSKPLIDTGQELNSVTFTNSLDKK
jgi:hypothetical protein